MRNEGIVIRAGTLAFIAFILLSAAFGQRQAQETSRIQVSRIAPGFSIVTEVSSENPYLGQQFSIIYRMEASKPPLAVDIDPQQFSGLWSEIAPLRENASTHKGSSKGDANFQYWLRQVVAYPLIEGPLQLPPLQVKIKTSESSALSSDDWDLVKTSDSVIIHVTSPFKAKESRDEFPLVGTVEGKISQIRRGEQVEATLEMWGTANLDLFSAIQWIRSPGNLPLSIRLSARENTIQTQDIGGRRRVSLLQRRCWTVKSPWEGNKGIPISDINLPVFDAQRASWGIKRVVGIGSGEIGAKSDFSENSAAIPEKQRQEPIGPWLIRYKPWYWIVGFVVLIMVVIALKFFRGRLAP
jgi:hypothetical protein